MEGGRVKKRCVLYINGYEARPLERRDRRLRTELNRFASTWKLQASVADAAVSADGHVIAWRVKTGGPNWQVETDFRLLQWDDFIANDFARPDWQRLGSAVVSFADFVWSGTAFRYFRINWRYGLFFLYPIAVLTVFLATALLAGIGVLRLELPLSILVAFIVAATVFFALIRWAGPPLSLPYALNLWIFAREFVRHRRLGVDDRLDRFARELVERARDPTIDEIVVASHSLGAALMLDVIDRALRSDPDMARRDQLCVLTPGSSLLQVGLHPAAGGLRAAVGRVANHPIVYWVDYQALIDPVNFYKADPVVAMGLPAAKNPIIRIVRISRMVADATYRRMRGDFLRLHRQFVMGNERRYRYDFFMICCGPMSLRARVEYPDRAVGAFAPDGAYAGLAADEMLK